MPDICHEAFPTDVKFDLKVWFLKGREQKKFQVIVVLGA